MTEERDFEQEARQEGWLPQEEWDGPPERWKPAQEFVEVGERISGILKKKLDSVEERLQAAEQANKRFGEYHKKTLQESKAKAKQTIEQLKKQIAEAVTNGDGQEYTRLSDQMDRLQQVSSGPTPEQEEWENLSSSWVSNNKWYGGNDKLTAFADGISDRIRAEGYEGQAYFKELTRRVKDNFPEEFQNENRGKAGGVEAPGTKKGNSSSKKQSYENLPADAKRACDEFVAEGFMTRAEYLEVYEWDDEE